MAANKNIDTKNYILESVSALIDRSEVENISLADIARAAHISKGTLYYYYTSKDAIMLDLTMKYLQEFEADFFSWFENKSKDTSPVRLIAYILDRGSHAENRARTHLYLISRALSGNAEIKERFRIKYAEWRLIIERALSHRMAQSENCALLAQIVLFLVDGIITQETVCNSSADCEKIAKMLCGMQADGIKPIEKLK